MRRLLLISVVYVGIVGFYKANAAIEISTYGAVTHVTPYWTVTSGVGDMAYGRLKLENKRPVWISVNLYGLGSHGYISNGSYEGGLTAPNAFQVMPPWCTNWSQFEYFIPPGDEIYFDFSIPIRDAPYELWLYKGSEPLRYVGCLDTFVYWKFGSHIPAGVLTSVLFTLKEFTGISGKISAMAVHLAQGEYGDVLKDIVDIIKEEKAGVQMFAELARISGHPIEEKVLKQWAVGLGDWFRIPEAVDILLTLYFTADDEKYEFVVNYTSDDDEDTGNGSDDGDGDSGGDAGDHPPLPELGGTALIVSNRGTGWQGYLSDLAMNGEVYSGSTFPSTLNYYDLLVLDDYPNVYDENAGNKIRNYVSGGGDVLIVGVVPGKIAVGSDLAPISDWLGAEYFYQSSGTTLTLSTTQANVFSTGYATGTVLYNVSGGVEVATWGLTDLSGTDYADWSSYGAGLVGNSYGSGNVVYTTVGLPGDYGQYGSTTEEYYYVLAYALSWLIQ
jgi:hypothetical protein